MPNVMNRTPLYDKIERIMRNYGSQIRWRLSAIIVAVLFALSSVQAQAPPLPSGPLGSDEVRFAALGDTGNGNEGQASIARAMFDLQRTAKFDLIVFLGDNIYNSGSPGDFGRKFTLPYRQFIENGTQLRGVLGNHDVRGEADGGVLLQQLMLGMGTRPYFAFTRGNGLVEFFGLDSNAFVAPNLSSPARQQLQWLDGELGRSKAPWKVVLLHHPLYSSAKKHGWNSRDSAEIESVRAAVEPLIVRHGVKLVLAGHDHVYERLKPQKGVSHFTSGAGSETRVGDLQPGSPFFTFGNDRETSFMLFAVRRDSIEFWSLNSQGKVLDSGTIR